MDVLDLLIYSISAGGMGVTGMDQDCRTYHFSNTEQTRRFGPWRRIQWPRRSAVVGWSASVHVCTAEIFDDNFADSLAKATGLIGNE